MAVIAELDLIFSEFATSTHCSDAAMGAAWIMLPLPANQAPFKT